MIIITHCRTTRDSLENLFGQADYSYYFIFERYLPVLERLGQVIEVGDPEREIDGILDSHPSERCVYLSFTPPHLMHVHPRCPTVCVFAWEFSSIPDGVVSACDEIDWAGVLADAGNAAPLSTYTASVLTQSLPVGVNVAAIPAPVPVCADDDIACAPLQQALTLNAEYYDSWELAGTGGEDAETHAPENLPTWDDSPLEVVFSESNTEAAKLLVGFYAAESWGVWSRTSSPQIYLPAVITGPVTVAMELTAYGENIGRDIELAIGESTATIVLTEEPKIYEADFNVADEADSLRFSNLDLASAPGRDYRTLGVGVKKLVITRPQSYRKPLGARISEGIARLRGLFGGDAEVSPGRELALQGVVYTSVFNPDDGRKNWEDMVTAFCWAFRDCEDATLLLKMSNKNASTFLGTLKLLFSTLPAFKCRVVAVHGLLSDAELRALAGATHFVVNTSLCEGQCLPLMEFMAQGIPAIAPDHTAMADYVNKDNAFVVASGLQPGFWPFDKHRSLGTLRYRIDWLSLKDAFEASHALLRHNEEGYRMMSVNAHRSIRDFAGPEAVNAKLETFLSAALDQAAGKH
ncbi:MAG: hypothetical protein Hals2KO_26510 [Halioglobus sp.]